MQRNDAPTCAIYFLAIKVKVKSINQSPVDWICIYHLPYSQKLPRGCLWFLRTQDNSTHQFCFHHILPTIIIAKLEVHKLAQTLIISLFGTNLTLLKLNSKTMPAFKTLLPKKDSGGDDLSILKEELLVLAALKSNDVDDPESIELMHSISDEVEQCTTLEEVETLMHSITVEVKQGTTEEEVETLFTDAAALPVPVAAVKPSKDQDDAAPMPESDTAKKVAEMKVEMEKKLEAAKKAAEAERIEAEKREKLRREKAEKAAELERLAVAKREEIKAQKAAEAALEAQRKAEKAAEEAVRRAEIREEKERQKELERQRKKQAVSRGAATCLSLLTCPVIVLTRHLSNAFSLLQTLPFVVDRWLKRLKSLP